MPAENPFIIICGTDDFLVSRAGKARYEKLAAEIPDEFSREIISAYATRAEDLREAINRFRESVQTISMFGGRRLVWLKDLDIAPASKKEGDNNARTEILEELQQLLSANDPAHTAILITATPVDKRRAFYKWCEKNADFTLVGGDGKTDNRLPLLHAEARELGVKFEPGADELLLEKIGQNTRFLIEELHKLANHAADTQRITQAAVEELTPNVAEGDFFEATDTFFSGNLAQTLEALRRHFYAGGDARPLLASLQNRNRLLIQLTALADSGQIRTGYRGIEKAGFDKAAAKYARAFAHNTEKSPCNVFTQHPFYLSKLLGGAKLPPLRRLIENQFEFLRAFEDIISRPKEQESVLREMTIRCLA